MRKCLEQNRDIKNYVLLYIKPDKPDPNVSVNYYEMRLLIQKGKLQYIYICT